MAGYGPQQKAHKQGPGFKPGVPGPEEEDPNPQTKKLSRISVQLKPGSEGRKKGKGWKPEGDGEPTVLTLRGLTEVWWETREGLGWF